MNQVLGLQKSKLTTAGMKGQRLYASGSTVAGSLDNTSVTPKTFFTTSVNQVAVIDAIDLSMVVSPAISTAARNVTVTIGTQTMTFTMPGAATQGSNKLYKIRPKGTMIVAPSTAFKVGADVNSFSASAVVTYRLMNVDEATSAGYFTSGFWCCTSPSIAVAGTAQSITGFAAADVTASRYLEINGIVVTGALTNGAVAAPVDLLLEFTNGAATHRKVFRTSYVSSTVPELTPPTFINHCVIRGPAGYGLRVTAGQTGTNARIALWGRYGIGDPKTFPGTGIVPSAGDALDAQEYFWAYSEATALGVYEIFPSTAGAKQTGDCVLDGYYMQCHAGNGGGSLISIAGAATVQNIVPTYVTPFCAVGTPGIVTGSDDNVQLPFRVSDRLGMAVRNDVGTAQRVSQLVWGRCGGTSNQNTSSATSFTKRFKGGEGV